MITGASQSARAAQPIASAVGLTKTYGSGEAAVTALNGVTIEFDRSRLTAIMGRPGRASPP